ncbi:MAG: DUF6036 family nucleotidyltransferase [Steroidobacteraceae bacterium]
MKRSELEHVIRAVGAIADDREVVVIGSQAILGQFPNAPAALLASAEADVFPLNRPELADLIEGSIGEGSAFHELYGYYAQGVDQRTSILPRGWRQRLVKVMNANTNGIAGMCLEVHDLAISKYVAGRPKDLDFTRELARHRMTNPVTLRMRLDETEVSAQIRKIVDARISRDFPGVRSPRKGNDHIRKLRPRSRRK